MLTIGIVGPDRPDSFADNIRCGIEDLGHQAVLLPVARMRRLERNRATRIVAELVMRSDGLAAELQRRPLLAATRRHRFDTVIVADSVLSAEATEALGDVVRPLCFWFPDAISNLARQTMFGGFYDVVCFKEPRLVDLVRRLAGLDAHLLSQGCNPRWHRVPDGRVDVEPHLAVAGNYYPYRIRLLERLHRAGIPLRLYGNPIPPWAGVTVLDTLHTGTYLSREAKARAFRGAAGVLNTMHPAEVEGVNSRLYEAAACGACVLSEDRPELTRQFKPDDEVLTFSTFDELVDRARWCLDHPDEARAMGDRATARAHAEHTYAHRVRDLLGILGLRDPTGDRGEVPA